MPAARPSAVALHIEAAKRLLQELELHADTAMNALGRERGTAFTTAVEERDRILEELSDVVRALARAREVDAADGRRDPQAGARLGEMTRAAASALESHKQLVTRTRQERDRLAAALKATTRSDSVANHYAAASMSGRPRTLSITG